MMVLHVSREFETVKVTRHIDIREHHSNVRPLNEEDDCIICCARLNHLKSGLFEDLDYKQAEQSLILDDEHEPTGCVRLIHGDSSQGRSTTFDRLHEQVSRDL